MICDAIIHYRGFVWALLAKLLPFRHFTIFYGNLKCKILGKFGEQNKKNWTLLINNVVDSTQKSNRKKWVIKSSHIARTLSMDVIPFDVAFFSSGKWWLFVRSMSECECVFSVLNPCNPKLRIICDVVKAALDQLNVFQKNELRKIKTQTNQPTNKNIQACITFESR